MGDDKDYVRSVDEDLFKQITEAQSALGRQLLDEIAMYYSEKQWENDGVSEKKPPRLVSDREETIPPMPARIRLQLTNKLKDQLSAARYTYHRQMVKRYGDMVRQGMPMEQGEEMYRLSMENYDSIIKSAADGKSQEANEADMEKGFAI